MNVTATYRIQLRNGVTFDTVTGLLPYLADLGVSHVYLSPIFTATEGSTHGYDVTDPGEIDPVLGGRAGFDRLAAAADDAGLGLMIDIVPNHTAFTVQNPWLADVLTHGRESRYAGHFDIDWAKRLLLPWLGEPFDDLLAKGEVEVRDGAMHVHGFAVPLAPGTGGGSVEEVHARQHWRLVHWITEREEVSHRRFFNVTGLIGMRVEDHAVFDDMHALTFDLIRGGQVDALRLDHIDGLLDPGAYLARLKRELPRTPIWVEKILVGDERLPDWGLMGTTGYEAARKIAQVLTDAKGHARIVADWHAATGRDEDFATCLEHAKRLVLTQELVPEYRQLVTLAGAVVEAPESVLKDTVLALMVAFPRYRTYFAESADPRDEDIALMAEVRDAAACELDETGPLDALHDAVIHAQTDAEISFRSRFQQVAGALLAKSHEDTAEFRWNAYLAANEVGAEPGHAVIDAGGFGAWLSDRAPGAMTLTSTHDTKRSEDSRMRMAAMSHLPEEWEALWADAETITSDAGANERWFTVQSALGLWGAHDGDVPTRLRDHLTKALREAKEITDHLAPDEHAEAGVHTFADALLARWRSAPPAALDRLIARGQVLSLIQTALKLTMPGMPDIYQGCEGQHLALTDPDNRLPVDWEMLATLAHADGFAGDKARLTRTLLRLRRTESEFFAKSDTSVAREGDVLLLVRRWGGRRLTVRADLSGQPLAGGSAFGGGPDGPVTVDLA